MAIPQYQDFMTPVLTAFQDNKPKNHSEVERIVVPQLHLTKEDCAQLLPSGTQTIVRNRLSWAIYYMYRAGLLKQQKRGVYIITEEGKKALQSGKTINNAFLEQFPSFQVFQNKTNKAENKQEETDPATRISNAIEEFNKRTQLELLEQLKTDTSCTRSITCVAMVSTAPATATYHNVCANTWAATSTHSASSPATSATVLRYRPLSLASASTHQWV